MSGFAGFSDRALGFYRELAADNSRDYWVQHKAVYESQVRDPLQAMLSELEPEFGPGKLFRPNRDIRFSADKSPYKAYQGAIVGPSPGIGYYVQLDADGLVAGGGFHSHSNGQVERFRAAVDDDSSGSALAGMVSELEGLGFEIAGEQLKRVPRGFAADHPRESLLRRKSLMATKRYGRPDWLASPTALDEVRTAWRHLRPVNQWIDEYVGAAE